MANKATIAKSVPNSVSSKNSKPRPPINKPKLNSTPLATKIENAKVAKRILMLFVLLYVTKRMVNGIRARIDVAKGRPDSSIRSSSLIGIAADTRYEKLKPTNKVVHFRGNISAFVPKPFYKISDFVPQPYYILLEVDSSRDG